MTDRRTVVVDTNVLLTDPRAIYSLCDQGDQVVLAATVLRELDSKKGDPELGYYAREAARILDGLSARRSLRNPVLMGRRGGTLQLDTSDVDAQPRREGDGDSRILATAIRLSQDGPVTLLTNDLLLRVRARSTKEAEQGTLTAEQHVPAPVDTTLPSFTISQADISLLRANQRIDVVDGLTRARAASLPVHAGVLLLNEGGKVGAVGRVTADGTVRLVPQEGDVFGIEAHSPEQSVAMALLRDSDIPAVSLGGAAGTGKSALALAAGLDAALERREFEKVMVFRPLHPVGGQELGYLPGSQAEKMGPWAQAVFDTLQPLVAPEVIEEVLARKMLEVLPLTHIRGRSFHNAFVIVDEAQGLSREDLLGVISRAGKGTKVVLTHDVAQRDNPRVGRHDGVAAILRQVEGHPLFAQVVLTHQERSPLARLAGDLLDGREVVKGRRPVGPPPLDRVPTRALPEARTSTGVPVVSRGAAGAPMAASNGGRPHRRATS